MEYVTFGRTGQKVSVAGLGCGGWSQLGLAANKSEADVIGLIRLALDLGINLLDTGADYGTEEVVGKAIKSVKRDSIMVNTKVFIGKNGDWFAPERVVAALDEALRKIDTDYIDTFQIHSLRPQAYDYAMSTLVPALLRERDKGKLRFVGMSEAATNDVKHEMLQRAVNDDCWGSGMVGFHMMHQNARETFFAKTKSGTNRMGSIVMCAVRNVFSKPQRLHEVIAQLISEGKLDQKVIKMDDPLGFLVHEAGASSVTDAAYRFARYEPGVDVVLFGTGDPEHLRSNVKSLLKPPLPEADRQKIVDLFGHLVGVAMDSPPATTSGRHASYAQKP